LLSGSASPKVIFVMEKYFWKEYEFRYTNLRRRNLAPVSNKHTDTKIQEIFAHQNAERYYENHILKCNLQSVSNKFMDIKIWEFSVHQNLEEKKNTHHLSSPRLREYTGEPLKNNLQMLR